MGTSTWGEQGGTMDHLALAQARHDEIEQAIAKTAPARLDVDHAFKDLFLTYVASVLHARKHHNDQHLGSEIWLSPRVYDRARRAGLFALARHRHPGVSIYRKREHHVGVQLEHRT